MLTGSPVFRWLGANWHPVFRLPFVCLPLPVLPPFPFPFPVPLKPAETCRVASREERSVGFWALTAAVKAGGNAVIP